jgi:hypothetical protein
LSQQTHKEKRRTLAWRLVVVASVIFLLATAVYFLLLPLRESKRMEQALTDRFGSTTEYTPPIDGHLPADRIEGFIRARQKLQASCLEYQHVLDSLLGLESIDSDVEMSGEEKASRGIAGLKGMLSAVPTMIEYMEQRNSILMNEEMGFGEYLHLYLASYGEQLAKISQTPYGRMDEAHISSRARSEFTQILENQLIALQEASDDSSSDLITELKLEINALNNGTHLSPWPNGPPTRTKQSLAPFEDQTDPLFCAGMVQLELLQKNKGLNLKG